jgi:hypothetical protein
MLKSGSRMAPVAYMLCPDRDGRGGDGGRRVDQCGVAGGLFAAEHGEDPGTMPNKRSATIRLEMAGVSGHVLPQQNTAVRRVVGVRAQVAVDSRVPRMRRASSTAVPTHWPAWRPLSGSGSRRVPRAGPLRPNRHTETANKVTSSAVSIIGGNSASVCGRSESRCSVSLTRGPRLESRPPVDLSITVDHFRATVACDGAVGAAPPWLVCAESRRAANNVATLGPSGFPATGVT